MPPPGVPPPRPPGLPLLPPREANERSRGVRFDGPPKVRSYSCDDVFRCGRQPAATGVEDGEDAGDDLFAGHVLGIAAGGLVAAGQLPIAAGHGHHIRVAVRCRPVHYQELQLGLRTIVKVVDDKNVILEDPQITAADDYLRLNKSKERKYGFDEAFDEAACTQQVYERTSKLLIPGVLQGFNATVFAYGATGAGKTHTMLGNPSTPGIMVLTLQDLFHEVATQKDDRLFEVKCSFLEVYNENVRDLLRPDADYLDIREDPVKGMCVAGISEVVGLESARDIMTLLHQANKHRSTEATGVNVTSSRSHAVLQVVVEQRDRTADIVAQVNVGKLSMIDLAGSERASQTNNKGMRMIEGANINRSLLALGNCITALSSCVAFVPYRDSKMTRLLKDSLGGNCRTAMIANVSPTHLNYEDTHNTLKYAKRASNIKTKAVRNVVRANCHVSKYTDIIKELRSEISELKGKLAGAHGVNPPTEGPAAGEVEGLDVQSAKWKQELIVNFEERVKIKRQLIDCAHEAQTQQVQKSHAQVGISQWESARVQGEHDEFEAPQNIRDLQEQLKSLKLGMTRKEEMTHVLEKQLVGNQSKAEKLQAELPSRVQNKDMRAFLGLISRIYVMEVENMDMEEMNEVMAPLLEQKDLEAEALRLQIQMRDRLIEDQDQILINEGVAPPANPEGWVDVSNRPPRRLSSPLAFQEDTSCTPRGRKRAGNNGSKGRAASHPMEAKGRGPIVLPPLSPRRNGARTPTRDPPRSPGICERSSTNVQVAQRRQKAELVRSVPPISQLPLSGAAATGANTPAAASATPSAPVPAATNCPAHVATTMQNVKVSTGNSAGVAASDGQEVASKPLDVTGRGIAQPPANSSGPARQSEPISSLSESVQQPQTPPQADRPLDVAGKGFNQPGDGESATKLPQLEGIQVIPSGRRQQKGGTIPSGPNSMGPVQRQSGRPFIAAVDKRRQRKKRKTELAQKAFREKEKEKEKEFMQKDHAGLQVEALGLQRDTDLSQGSDSEAA